MRRLRVVLVDDEHLARERMRDLAAEHPDLEIAGEAATGPDAVVRIDELRPDFVLLDIALPTMNAFEVLSCLECEPLPLIVFMTAYDEHAVRAFEVHAIDYLLKPVERERFAEAMQRVRQRVAARDEERPQPGLDAWMNASAPRSRLAVRTGNRIVFVKPKEIDYVEAVGNYVKIHRGAERLLVRQSLSALEARLRDEGFVRAQRSLLVNLECVAELRREAREVYTLVLSSGAAFRVSEHYRPGVERALQLT